MTQNQQPSSQTATSADRGMAQYLRFLLGEEEFAIDIRTVREIIQFGVITPVPLMPSFVRGVINLRGAVVPVIDLKARFGWVKAEIGKKTCVIIFDVVRESERIELGLMVDAVSEVVDIADHQIEAAPQFGSVIQRDYIRGVGKHEGKFVVILDPDRTLDIDALAQVVEQTQTGA